MGDAIIVMKLAIGHLRVVSHSGATIVANLVIKRSVAKGEPLPALLWCKIAALRSPPQLSVLAHGSNLLPVRSSVQSHLASL